MIIKPRVLAMSVFAPVIYILLAGAAQASCNTFNYANEFVVSNFDLVTQTSIDVNTLQVTISADVQNTNGAELGDTTAVPDLRDSQLVIGTDEAYFQPLRFGLVGPFASAASDIAGTNLVLRIAAAELDDLLTQLNDGSIPMMVTGNETLELQPDVYAFAWGESADLAYAGVLVFDNTVYQEFDSSGDIFQDSSSLTNMSWNFTPGGTLAPGICSAVPGPGQQFYVWENALSGPVDADGINSGLRMPQGLRYGRMTSANYFPGNEDFTDELCAANATGTTAVAIMQLNALTWDIQSAIKRGTFCSGESAFLDQPVAQTRFIVPNTATEQPLDAEPGSETAGNLQRDVQPLRINNLQLGDLRVNGQVQGYALKPRISVRVKPQGVEFQTSIDSDLNMALQVTADQDISLLDMQDIPIGQLCFPLPPIPVGFAILESSLDLDHTLDVAANMKAGVTFGIEKQFRGGYRTGWDPARAAGDEFYSETFFSDRPLTLTPPRLVTDASADAEIASSFRATLRLGGSLCQYAGPFVRARLAANVQATLLPEPAWTLGHDARLDAGLTIDLLGINLLQRSAPLVTFTGNESLSGNNLRNNASRDPALAPGSDQRWAINVQDLTSPGGKIWVVDTDTTADGGLVAVTSAGQPGGQERVIRFSPSGEPLWDIQYAGIQTRVSEVQVRPDGNLLVAGDLTSSEGVWLALHDGDGTEIWNRQYEPTNDDGDYCTVEEMIAFTDSGGAGGILLAGNSGSTTNQTARPCVLRLDEDGNPLWSRVAGELTFANSGDSADWELYDVIYTRDDGFLLVGYFNYLPFGDFQTTLPWAMKLDPDGYVSWETRLAIPSENARIGIFKAVTQSATGEFYLTGSVGGTVNETGGMLVAQLSEDGSDGKGAILYYARFNQGSPEDANDDPNHWTVSDDVAATGNDTGRDIVAVDGGAVLVGTFSTKYEAWIIRVNEHLGVEWFNSYDGVFEDSFNSIDVTDSGLIVAGVSQSIVPNSALQGLAGKATLMVMNVPFEGLVNDFYPTLDIYRRYVLPTVFQGPDYYANSPMIRALPSAEPLPLVAGTVTDLGTNDSLLRVTPEALCASVLTASSGVSSPLYFCDADSDGLDDVIDNCPTVENTDQSDLDGDGEGDACDTDIDGDGLDNENDNCVFLGNAGQRDTDADGIGNVCDPDVAVPNDCIVNFLDLNVYKANFFAPGDLDTDNNGDLQTNFVDLNVVKSFFFGPPGPSAAGCN